MRILWLSPTPGLLYENEGSGGYGGSGWVASLEHLFCQYAKDHQLAVAFVYQKNIQKQKKNGVIYYPIFDPPISSFQKFLKYYGGYKKYNREKYIEDVKSIIADYKPDIIHLFGIESPLATILGKVDIPIVVHLQGLLGPCDNAFFPEGFNKTSFLWPFSKREYVIRNGYIFAKNDIHVRGQRESVLFKDARFFMGRTEWDYQVSQLMSPMSKYFKINEALRPEFYEAAGKWQWRKGKFIVTSTISETIYKGLDLILKTAKLLKEHTDIEFEWRVVGIKSNSDFIKFFEKNTHINSAEVNVCYMGCMSAAQLVQNALDSSVYVHPSYIDNSPNSVCESQILGLPVIATNVGGVSSLVEHKVTGILVPANAPYELAYNLKKMSLDIQMCNRLSTEGVKSSLNRHSKYMIIKDLLSSYFEIISE